MSQSRLGSAIEAVVNILIGMGVALLSQMVVFPLVGIPDQQLSTHLTITLWFTAISFARSYIIRRWFATRMTAAINKLTGDSNES